MRELKRFFMALGFFTRLPIPAWVGYSPDELNHSSRYFPLVGLVVGGICSAILYLLTLFLPVFLAVSLCMLFSLLLTGGFHEDGLADCADAFGGGWGKENILRIMKDSRLGSYGTLAIVMALLIKFSALSALMQSNLWLAIFALLIAHILSRTAVLWVMVGINYVRDDETSKAKPLAKDVGKAEIGIGTVCGLFPLIGLAIYSDSLWPALFASFWFCAMAVPVASRYFYRRLGGYTGDCLGATQQVCELGIYCILCAFLIA